MNYIYSMLQLFGERFVFCDDDQAQLDAAQNRDLLVSAYSAIMDYVEKHKDF